MLKEEHISYWLTSAHHDLEAAESLFSQSKYDWCLFIGHLVLEKALKALFVKTHEENSVIPKTHNLLKLAEFSKISLSDTQRLSLLNFNDFNIEARYPDYKLKFYTKCDKEFTENNFTQIKEMYQWLLLKLQNK
jgi:HEPN domain-containing protein